VTNSKLVVGSSYGASDLYNSTTTGKSVTVGNIPINTKTQIYVSLSSYKNGIWSPPTQYVYAIHKPTVTLSSPGVGNCYVAHASVTLTATALSGAILSSVKFYNGATLLALVTSSPFTYSWTNVPAGSYSLTAYAVDNFNFGMSSNPVTLNVQPYQAATLSLSAPTNNASYTAPANINFSVNAASACGVTKVEFYNGSTLLSTATNSPYTYTWSNVSQGSYNFTAKAYYPSSPIQTSSAVNANVYTTTGFITFDNQCRSKLGY
jgi:hypothetical protein